MEHSALSKMEVDQEANLSDEGNDDYLLFGIKIVIQQVCRLALV